MIQLHHMINLNSQLADLYKLTKFYLATVPVVAVLQDESDVI